MEKANSKQTIFSSKPLGVTAWIFLAINALKLVKTVSMYWPVGLLKNCSHAAIGRLDLFFRWALRGASRPLLASPRSGSRSSPSQSVNDRAFGQFPKPNSSSNFTSASEAAASENSTGPHPCRLAPGVPLSRRSSGVCSPCSHGRLGRVLLEDRASRATDSDDLSHTASGKESTT